MRLRWLLIIMCLAVSFIPVGIIGGFQGFEIATAFLGLIIIVTFFVSLFVSYFITLPIENLTRNIEEISKGNLDVKVVKSEIYEINKLTEALNRVMSSLKLAIHKVGVKKGEIFEETMKAKETAEEKFKHLLNSIDELAWEINEKGVITYCSDNVKDVLGYTSTDIIGQNIYELIPPEKSKKFRSIFQKAVKKKPQKNDPFETDLVHKDGYNVPFITRFHPLFDDLGNLIGFRGISKDLLESKLNKEKIEELNDKLSDMRERMRDILNEKEKTKYETSWEKTSDHLTNNTFNKMLIFDENGNILDCNEDFCKSLGYKKDEMLRLNLTDIDSLETIDDIKKKIITIKKQGSITLKTIHRTKNGSSIFVSENIEYLKDKNLFKCNIKEDNLLHNK